MLNFVVVCCVLWTTCGAQDDTRSPLTGLPAQELMKTFGPKEDFNIYQLEDGGPNFSVQRVLEAEKDHYALLNKDLNQFQSYLKEVMASKDKQVDVTAEILEMRTEIGNLRSEVLKLKTELAKQSEERDQLASKQSIQNQEATIEWLKSSLSELRQDVLEIDQQNNISLAIQRQEDTGRQISLIRADLVAILGQIEQVKVENKKCENRLQEATSDLKTVSKNHDNLAATLSQVKNKVESEDWVASAGRNNDSSLDNELVHPHHHHREGHGLQIKMLTSVVKRLESRMAGLESQVVSLETNSSVVTDLLMDLRQKMVSSEVVPEVHFGWQDQIQSTAITLSDRLSVLEEVSLQNTNELVNLTTTIMGLHGLHESTVKIFNMLDRLGDELDDNIAEFKMELAQLHFQSTQFSASLEVQKQDQADMSETLSSTRKDLLLYRERQESDHYRLLGLHNEILNQSLRVCTKENGDLLQDLKIASIEKKMALSSAQFSTLQVKSDSLRSSLDNKVDLSHHSVVTETTTNLTASYQRLREELRSLMLVSNTFSRQLPSDCQSFKKLHPGVQLPTPTLLMLPNSNDSNQILKPVGVWCEEDPQQGIWTVIQRRVDGSENFYRNWSDYVTGFGRASGEFWVGLEALHELTKNNDQELTFELWDSNGRFLVANYQTFVVGPASANYRLQVSGYSGNATDAMSHHQNMEFSTADRDNDASSTHCAQYYLGGWWYGHCQYANINGRYGVALTWYDVELHTWIELSRVHMKIRTKPTPFDS